MNKIVLVLFLVLSVQIISQQKHRKYDFGDQPEEKFIYTQTLIFPGDSLSDIYYTFKLPHKNIVFIRNGENYKSEISLALEVTGSNSGFVSREIKNWKITASSFNQTISGDIFAEGFVNLKLGYGSYNILPIITDLNSNHEFKLKKQTINIVPELNIDPVIVNSNKITCDGKEFFSLANFEGNIPFGSAEKKIIIPVDDLSVKEINVKVISKSDTIASTTVTESFISSLKLKECSDKIIISDGEGKERLNFILNGITSKLREGPFTIVINDGKEKTFSSVVYWYNKPNSLKIPELAVNALIHIDEERRVDSLSDLKDETKYAALVNYWKKMDPTPGTEYNELMAEYYTRVDYVQNNFSTLTGTTGIDTDRGKIYLKFGKPDLIERASNEKGKVVETWTYTKIQRKFVFVDKQGTGEFSLESS